uniref:Methyltransferase domain-containing protein n=1 Tax=Candidatus Kentrum sp. FM TaxID=2126340 RepID=A0A450STV7_9GAMM|nr:MAG: Methyltransferase domain-containing protein [Candidatus Kentron sp. FM]VFJ58029.1 MAG: Methyltransferase domain-containing protein [Candidatus Kentron sp. FM]VFK11831.1 MAG: Methyltransferase domain-containing protein [Candidatus Kentron sp. FM]
MNYFMDDEREAGRLTDKVDPRSWVDRFIRPHMPGVENVLDVGCGPGVLAQCVAEAYGDCRVIGLDASERRLETARKQQVDNLSFEKGDAQRLPFDDDRFDLVYCRFLLEYLPSPRTAIREMARVCRPGGRILLQDLDGQLVWHYPIEPELEEGISQTLPALRETGFDPFIGRKLFHFAVRCGLKDIQVDIEPYHLIARTVDEENLRLWELKLDIALPMIAEAWGSEEKAEQLKAAFIAHLKREDSLTYSNLCTVTGIVP